MSAPYNAAPEFMRLVRSAALLGWWVCAGGCALSGGSSGAITSTAPPVVPRAAAPAPKDPVDKVSSGRSVAPGSAAVAVSAGPVSAVIPPAAQKLFDGAVAQLKAGQVAAARPALLQLTHDYPNLPAAWLNLGLMESKAGHTDEALGYFQRAVENNPTSPLAQTYLGIAYRQAGKFKEAEAAYQAALQADGQFAQAHFNLGVLYDLYLQQPALALQHYEDYQALQTAPDSRVAGWIKDLKNRLNSKAKGA